MESGTLQNALDAVDALGPEDQRFLVELVSRRLAEHRRAEISRNADETLQAVRDGSASVGTVDDLRKDLLGDA